MVNIAAFGGQDGRQYAVFRDLPQADRDPDYVSHGCDLLSIIGIPRFTTGWNKPQVVILMLWFAFNYRYSEIYHRTVAQKAWTVAVVICFQLSVFRDLPQGRPFSVLKRSSCDLLSIIGIPRFTTGLLPSSIKSIVLWFAFNYRYSEIYHRAFP